MILYDILYVFTMIFTNTLFKGIVFENHIVCISCVISQKRKLCT